MSLGRTVARLTWQHIHEALVTEQWSIRASAQALGVTPTWLTEHLRRAQWLERVRQNRLAARPPAPRRPARPRVRRCLTTHRWRFESRVWSKGTLTRTWRCRDCALTRREVAGNVPAVEAALYGGG